VKQGLAKCKVLPPKDEVPLCGMPKSGTWRVNAPWRLWRHGGLPKRYRNIGGATIDSKFNMTLNSPTNKFAHLPTIALTSIVLSAVSLALFVLAVNLHFFHPMAFALALLWTPVGIVSGLYVLFRAAAIIGKEPLGQQTRRITRFALLGAASALLSLVLIFLVTLFAPPDVQSPKDRIINDLDNLAADAYQYKVRPTSRDGGDGTYLGYQMPKHLRLDSLEGFSYRIISVYADSILLEGRCQNNQSGTIRVKMDERGTLTNWQYFGDIESH
jgi:hypothetical protein